MKKQFILMFVAIIFLTACNEEKIETNMSREMQSFEFTTQDKQFLSLQDLEGSWWVADTIFTNCTTVCPPMTANMASLQEKIKSKNLDVQLVSFSVDPDNDTPETLKKFGEKFQADFSNWTFLTGYDYETIKTLSIKSFQSMVKKIPDSNQVAHGTNFYLINPDAKVVKSYSGMESKEMSKIAEDLEKVLQE
nr:SCO family protein [Oceanobacillus manasiensis]